MLYFGKWHTLFQDGKQEPIIHILVCSRFIAMQLASRDHLLMTFRQSVEFREPHTIGHCPPCSSRCPPGARTPSRRRCSGGPRCTADGHQAVVLLAVGREEVLPRPPVVEAPDRHLGVRPRRRVLGQRRPRQRERGRECHQCRQEDGQEPPPRSRAMPFCIQSSKSRQFALSISYTSPRACLRP